MLGKLSMRERWQLGAHPGEIAQIDLSKDHPGIVRGPCQDLTPGIDDHRIAIGSYALGVFTELVRRDDVDLVLDRPGAQEGLPVSLSGRDRKSGGNKDDLSALGRQCAIEFGKAQVVADA